MSDAQTKGFEITIRQYGGMIGYIVAESAAKAKSRTIVSLDGDIKFTDITSCRRCPELDGRQVSRHCYASMEQVPS